MKNKIIPVFLFLFFSVLSVSAQTRTQKKDPVVGQWKFEAPYAPDGYQTGNIAISYTEKKYSASMVFTGSDYRFPGENIKVVKDSVNFSIYVEGESVAIRLKAEDASKMTGTATYSEGVIPLTLTKQ